MPRDITVGLGCDVDCYGSQYRIAELSPPEADALSQRAAGHPASVSERVDHIIDNFFSDSVLGARIMRLLDDVDEGIVRTFPFLDSVSPTLPEIPRYDASQSINYGAPIHLVEAGNKSYKQLARKLQRHGPGAYGIECEQKGICNNDKSYCPFTAQIETIAFALKGAGLIQEEGN